MPRIFLDMGFHLKMALPMLCLAALLVAVGGMGIQGMHQLSDSSGRLGNRYIPGISLLLNADRDMYQAQVAERSLLNDEGAIKAAALKKFHAENIEQAFDRMKKFAALQSASQAQPLLKDFDENFAKWKEATQRVIALLEKDLSAAKRLSYGESETHFKAARSAIDKLDDLEDEGASAEASAVKALSESRSLQQASVVVVGILLCIVLSIGFPILVTRPLHGLLHRVEQLADGDGDLKIRLDVRSKDELGRLSLALNRFLDKLQPLIQEVGRATAEVAQSARSLNNMSQESERLISSEHQSMDQVSHAADQMNSAVHDVARNAQHAADVAREAEAQSKESGKVVAATVQTIRQLAEEVGATAETIQVLEKETANIGAVLEVIKGIAEQTNLLALNAAIEAARAGEQGRGFAVVADEVRALAARTQESTKDIHNMIDRLQQGVQAAVGAMASGSAKAQDSVARASGVDEALAATSQSVGRISDIAVQIATACEEQSHVTGDIARSIGDIRGLSNRAAQTSEQSAQASQRLSELSANLERLVGRFRV